MACTLLLCFTSSALFLYHAIPLSWARRPAPHPHPLHPILCTIPSIPNSVLVPQGYLPLPAGKGPPHSITRKKRADPGPGAMLYLELKALSLDFGTGFWLREGW